MDRFNLLKEEQPNKKYSKKLLAVIMYTTIAGISFRFAYDNITPVNTNRADSLVEIQNEQPTAIPSLDLTITPQSGTGSQYNDPQTGTGSELTGTGSEIISTEDSKCGYIDSNSNKVVDADDFDDFQKNYMQTCIDTDIRLSDICGLKDFNKDKILDIADFINFSAKYRTNKCE